MATVRIGDKDLDVKPTTLGFIKRKLLPAQRALDEAKGDIEGGERLIELLHLYVGHNEGASIEWLEDVIPISDYARLAKECPVAAGQQARPGEAASQ